MTISTLALQLYTSRTASIVRNMVGAEEGEEAEGLLGTPYHQPSLAPEPLFHLGPLNVTNSMVTTVLVVLLLTALAIWMSRSVKLIPSGKQN
ncbi:MAG: hypothetical protein M3P51_04165, partial [Chloroflexota bacterium]|nr:hypothetical protein [Chloroflexota bacterium]